MLDICLCLSCFYDFQHLVTFSIEEEDDLASVEDATRKLAVMDAQGKIWAQEMLLQVNGSAIKLFDVDSKVKASQFCDVGWPKGSGGVWLDAVLLNSTPLQRTTYVLSPGALGDFVSLCRRNWRTMGWQLWLVARLCDLRRASSLCCFSCVRNLIN